MPRRLPIMAVAVLAVVLAAQVGAQPPWAQPTGRKELGFEGYWMGIDPLDGGDSRRSLVRLEGGTFAMAGRDSVLTLCDGTDRGFINFDDGVIIGNVLQTDSLTIECSNTGASVVLRARYEVITAGVIVEHTTAQDGSPVSRIVLHKVSLN